VREGQVFIHYKTDERVRVGAFSREDVFVTPVRGGDIQHFTRAAFHLEFTPLDTPVDPPRGHWDRMVS
jgi:hypothetical protein